MSITPFQALACPLDGKPLSWSDSVWRCSDGHSFDIAKQGYVNLLPVQQKRSHDPGDSKAMVAARQRFLGAGHYQAIAEAVSHAVLGHAEVQKAASQPFSCLDAGCGEGYYLRQLADAATNTHPLSLMGLDISKWAVLAAAKQDNKQAPLSSWVVGSNAHLPVQTETLDCVLCMFGFPVLSEFARVLRTGGVLLQVEAGPNHLRELREVIYPTLKPERSTEIEVLEGFTHHSSERVSYSLALNGSDEIADLLAMTPHLYRASAEGRARAAALEMLSVTVDVRLVIYTKV
ncbi:methyltransferase domain-containing protein [Halomonas sp. FeN2]|uniref:putative RNA methyltransferase n=1 Tax=Halomonadaceae TaxID=28256 RepID=UPI000C640AF6|nr:MULTISPECIES: methyltransferase domain-containing protein [unclassified Halomonas]MBF59637.1 rRNA (guanine-N1)-methyltransferase [Halomonas sp.]UBR48871.1 methyltransferase domain-containing protein [Halomonas sp. FeN2]|tara:strand:+ start:2021 stop:2887 length:867 start_codon:yes stop_codon:yes gene_type:complete